MAWQIILRAADLQPHHINLKTGETSVGRSSSNMIVIEDSAASRQHAKIIISEGANDISVIDLNSTNGTYLGSERISKSATLRDGDVLRIGQVLLTVRALAAINSVSMKRSHSYTRELVLESMDKHAILLYEIARKLNPISDLDTAITEIVRIISNAMRVDVCLVILKEDFHKLNRLEVNEALAQKTIRELSAEINLNHMYVPVVVEDEALGLIVMKKLTPGSRPFERSDLQLAIAISHQVSLTLHRLEIINQMQEEVNIKKMLMRFFTPMNAEKLVESYKEKGELPGLEEQKVTVMFSDIAGSTGLAEKLGVNQFAEILSNYYEIVTTIVFDHNGIVKYLGDGILAIFPEATVPQHEKEAVLSARELISSLNRTGALEAGYRNVIGVSLNTGKAMLGYVGTKDRAEFNVLGDAVNVAFHLQEYARPNKIIISSNTIAAVSNDFQFKRIGTVDLKGRLHGIQAFEVLL